MMAYPRQSQKDWLQDLNRRSKVPTAERVREALDLLREQMENPSPEDEGRDAR
tara:strand:- start:1887 stop:2045 length:159 start_codon:yes stop_codon:yes gene_type:complete